MAVSSISCSLKPPAAPFKEASSARPQPTPPATTTTVQWSGAGSLHRACVAAAACAVVGMSDGGAGMVLARDAAIASRPDGGGAVVAVDARAGGPPRWSDRRRCPAWRANSLENFVPENLPRPSAQRRFNGVREAETEAPALAPDAVLPFLARRSGIGCFSL